MALRVDIPLTGVCSIASIDTHRTISGKYVHKGRPFVQTSGGVMHPNVYFFFDTKPPANTQIEYVLERDVQEEEMTAKVARFVALAGEALPLAAAA